MKRYASVTLLVASVCGSGLWAQTRDTEPDALEAQCATRDAKGRGSGAACYWLSLRYRDGRGVPKDVARAEALLEEACGAYYSSDRACLTQCLRGKERSPGKSACEWLSLSRATLIEIWKLVVGAPDFGSRSRVISESRDVFFLRWVLTSPEEEAISLPQREELREVAAARVQDLALHDADPSKRRFIVWDGILQAFVDRDVLRKIAQSDPDPEVRQAAAQTAGASAVMLGTSSEKAALATTHKDPEVRREAVSWMNDQTALARIALSDPSSDVRAEAVSRLEDQKVLARIAEKDRDDSVRQLATSGLTDQAVLERLARKGRTGMIRQIAVEKVANVALVASVAEHDSDPEVRAAAVGRTADQAALRRIARSEKVGEIRGEAIKKITDPRELVELAVRDEDAWGYQAAIDGLRDEALVREVLERRWAEPGVVRYVASHTQAQGTVALVLEKATDDQAQLIAATRLTEPALVVGILGRDQRAWVRKTLVAKTTDRALVGRLAQSDPDPSARAAAPRRLAELK